VISEKKKNPTCSAWFYRDILSYKDDIFVKILYFTDAGGIGGRLIHKHTSNMMN